jgi:hypothetical protein
MAKPKIVRTAPPSENPRYTEDELYHMRRMRLEREAPGLHDVLVYYGNRKVYSRLHAGYITYPYIFELLKEGKKFSFRDGAFSGPDITETVVAEIWFHGYKDDPKFIKHLLSYRNKS